MSVDTNKINYYLFLCIIFTYVIAALYKLRDVICSMHELMNNKAAFANKKRVKFNNESIYSFDHRRNNKC